MSHQTPYAPHPCPKKDKQKKYKVSPIQYSSPVPGRSKHISCLKEHTLNMDLKNFQKKKAKISRNVREQASMSQQKAQMEESNP